MSLIALNFRIIVEDELEFEDFDDLGSFLAEDIQQIFENGEDYVNVEYMGHDIFENS